MKYLKIMSDGGHNLALPIINQSDYINVAVLAAGVAESFTVPDDASKVLFAATADFWCLIGAAPTAAIAVADVTDGSGSEFNPTARRVVAGEKISLISSVACSVSMAFYR